MLHFYLSKAWGIVKKAFIVITVYIVVAGLFITFTKPGQPKKNTIQLEDYYQQNTYLLLNDPKINSTKESKIAVAFLKATLCGTIGQACTDNSNDDKKNFDKSLFGLVTRGIMLPYANPPASGAYWLYSGLQNAGFIPKTYATAGIGFSSISLFMPIWKAFRDVAYIIMVIILIAIGFMIMFRMKMNPQTVVNIENSLPKIVITMLMITFSFAIAGFMIDFMYVLIILVIEIMSKAGNLNAVEQTNNIINSSALWSNLLSQFGLYWNGLNSLWQILPNIVRIFLGTTVALASTFISINIVGHFIPIISSLFADAQVQGQAGIVVLGVAINFNLAKIIAFLIAVGLSLLISPLVLMLLFILIVIIGLLTLMFRIFFMLLYSYVQVLIYIMFAPVFLITEALPGQKGFAPWFRNILGNLLVFPVVIALLLTVQVINQYSVNSLTTPITQPISQLVNNGIFLPPLLAGNVASAIRPQYFIAIINAIFLMIIPDLAKSFKQMIIGKGAQLPTNIGALWGAAGAGLSGGVGILGQISSAKLGLQATGLMGEKSTFGSTIKNFMSKKP